MLDFDRFTVDLNYLVEKVGKIPTVKISIEDVRNYMAKNDKHKTHLPNLNRVKALAAIKAELATMPEFQELLPIYQKLKTLAE